MPATSLSTPGSSNALVIIASVAGWLVTTVTT